MEKSSTVFVGMDVRHAATQRANISLIDRRSRWPRRVPYRAIEHCNSLTAHCGQDQLVSVDRESHINV